MHCFPHQYIQEGQRQLCLFLRAFPWLVMETGSMDVLQVWGSPARDQQLERKPRHLYGNDGKNNGQRRINVRFLFMKIDFFIPQEQLFECLKNTLTSRHIFRVIIHKFFMKTMLFLISSHVQRIVTLTR